MPTPSNKLKSLDTGLRLRLRSVYLKGHQDGLTKISDLSWEDKIIDEIFGMFKNWKKEL